MMTRTNVCTLLVMVVAASTMPAQPAAADDSKEHPSTAAQVRLASWWFARHSEKIAEIERANNPKEDKKIELLMVGGFDHQQLRQGRPW